MAGSTQRVERKLAAIFAADVAGYSRLMNEDEVGTLRTLTAHREIMDGLIAEHGGRIANTAGNSVLTEFPSAVDAVQCAVAVQKKLGKANTGVPGERRLQFRIGVHVGDVMVQSRDLLGDGVNIAARVQTLAEPGGVWISGRAHDEFEGKLPHWFEDKGEQEVKGIARPTRVCALADVSSTGKPKQAKALALPDKSPSPYCRSRI
jgi:adenylate cyclase